MPRVTGTYRPIDGSARAFIPFALPPRDPAIEMSRALDRAHAEALGAIDRLALAGRMVLSLNWFLYGFVRKEALLSSQIEGTQATLRDVVTFEATREAERPEDVEEVCNCVGALAYARRELSRPRGLPLSTRLLCEMHRRLMRGARGRHKAPGQLREVQNWVGGGTLADARFVPPPPDLVPGAMTDLERWIHAGDPLPPLVRAGLVHVQFETIHPFLDGNGRVGRLLITLLLEHWGVMPSPLLCLSVALKRRQREYYDRLSSVRDRGDFEGWTAFFLACVREAAADGVAVAARLAELLGRDRERIAAHPRSTVAAFRLLDALPEHPVVTAPGAADLLDASAPTARKAIEIAVDAGVLREVSGRQRGRVYAYHNYLRILTDGDDGS